MTRYFITGTDTGVGKTFVSCQLIRYWQNKKIPTLGLKPVASGSERTSQGLRNEDALAIQQHLNNDVEYQHINPYVFEPPIAPHLAAAQVNQPLTVAAIKQKINQAEQSYPSNNILIEGAGGWLVPLNKTETFADLAQSLSCEVILVVGLKLGCINHALLSQQAIQAKGLNLTGWVANQIDPSMLNIDDNIKTLQQSLSAPLLATVPHMESIQDKTLPFRNI